MNKAIAKANAEHSTRCCYAAPEPVMANHNVMDRK